MLLYRSPSASLGLFTLYQTSVQAIMFTTANLIHSTRMAYQGIFLMGAFCAAMEVEPLLQPKGRDVPFEVSGKGLKLDVKWVSSDIIRALRRADQLDRNLTYTYPGCETPVLRNVNLTVGAGETVAVVGFNGSGTWARAHEGVADPTADYFSSGKSTLAKILLRIYDFDGGEIQVNGVDIRRYSPEDFHSRCTAVFQDFARYNSSAQENIGVGYIDKMRCPYTLDTAMHLAGAKETVCSLPLGLKTKLDIAGQDDGSFQSGQLIQSPGPAYGCHGLSGGEVDHFLFSSPPATADDSSRTIRTQWQRIAISRAFMRADRPEVELLVFDEPVGSLDTFAAA